jgi:hypothetical protein
VSIGRTPSLCEWEGWHVMEVTKFSYDSCRGSSRIVASTLAMWSRLTLLCSVRCYAHLCLVELILANRVGPLGQDDLDTSSCHQLLGIRELGRVC